MSLDHYVTLGHGGLRVSPLCLGTMTFGQDWGWGSDVESSTRILDAYIGRGGNFIDTANIYTKGHSEKIIGDHIGRVPAKRDRLVIATKFMGNLYTGDPNGGGASRKSIASACEQSLRRLQTHYIDLYWMHVFDPYTPIEETMRTLDDLVRAGKVRYIGFSDVPAWVAAQAQTIAEFRGWSPLVALQIEYSLVQRTVEGELIPMARQMGMGVTPWSPLKGGILSGKYTRDNVQAVQPDRGDWVKSFLDERVFSILDAVHRVAAQTGSKPAQIALAWLNKKPGVTSPIIGARTPQQLDENLACLTVELFDAHMTELDEASRPTLDFPHDFLKKTRSVWAGGTTINGQVAEPWPLAPAGDDERY